MIQIHTADPLSVAAHWLLACAHVAAPLAVAALWQGAVVALVLGISLYVSPQVHIHLGAAQRFALWATAFAVVAALPILPALLHSTIGESPALPLAASARTPGLNLPQLRINDRWALVLAALWLFASLVRAAALSKHALHLRRIWRAASPVAVDHELGAFLAAASPRPIELATTTALDRPSVVGFLAPRILVPDWLIGELTADELRQVILHEAEHLRRRDDWTNLLQKVALILFPLNPALVWIERRLCREREMACDEGVVRRTRSPRDYAACLASLAERSLGRRIAQRTQAITLAAFERRPELVRRISRILSSQGALHPAAARALVAAAACALVAAAAELARSPQIVAFVPAAHETQLAHKQVAPAAEGDRVYREPIAAAGASGFGAVQTRAALPALSPLHGAASSRRARSESSRAGQDLLSDRAEEPGFAPVDTDAGMGSGVASAPAHQQFVLLTTWEVIDTSHQAHVISDYDTDRAAPTTQTTVSRMFVAIYSDTPEVVSPQPIAPRRKAVLPATESLPATRPKVAPPATGFDLVLPTAPQGGWLIFAL